MGRNSWLLRGGIVLSIWSLAPANVPHSVSRKLHSQLSAIPLSTLFRLLSAFILDRWVAISYPLAARGVGEVKF